MPVLPAAITEDSFQPVGEGRVTVSNESGEEIGTLSFGLCGQWMFFGSDQTVLNADGLRKIADKMDELK